jgi:hypothetical protein
VRETRFQRLLAPRLFAGFVAIALGPGCNTGGGKGELSRAQCVQMVLKVNNLRDKELGRATSVNQRNTVDDCMAHGTKAQFDCVQFANNAAELVRCEDLAK